MRKILLFTVLLFLAAAVQAQTRVVTGKVTSSDEAGGFPGVSVLVQGTNKGVSTDIEGNYSLEVGPGENTLVFSFVGYATQTVDITNRDVADVVLETDATELSEVVVVGYGVQKKSDITGATANIKGEELVRQPVLTATQALQGKVAGVQIISSGQPGSSPQIRIRGVGTALAGTTSLFVVDGVLTDDISNINTADIVDMNILKDASAAAIYGSRGANGVVIITTRKGASGKLKINYNNNIGFRQAANLVEMANSEEFRNYSQAAVGIAPPTSAYDTDWYDEILQTAFQQSHNISISGGTDNVTHFLSLGYLTDEGIIIGNDFKRLTARVNEDFKIGDKLKLGLLSSFSHGENENGFGNIDIDIYGNVGGVYNDAYRAAPIIPGKVDGKYGNTSAYGNVGNPLLDIENNSILVKENRLQGSAFLELAATPWLTLRSSIGADSRNSLHRGYYYKFANDETTFVTAGGNQNNPRSRLSMKQVQSFRWVWDNTATLHKKFNEHDFTLLVGTTAEKYNQTNFSATRSDIPADPDLWYIGVGDANSSQNDGGGDSWSRSSFLARLNYAFNEKYLLTATVRSDGSSRLPEENRWQQYPSFGLGWIISREGFFENVQLFDLLKLRASYGKVGNDQISTGAFTQVVAQNKPYNFNGSTSPAANGSQINQIIDPNITWETTEEYDLALEFELFQSRLTGEVNYYNKKVANALINVPIPGTVGDEDALVLTNVASIQNKGLEVLLNWRGRISDNLTYTVGGNVTFNNNEVVALNGGQAIRAGGVGGAQTFTTYTDNGQPVGSFYVLKVVGVFNTAADVASYTNSEGVVIQPGANPGEFKYYDKNDDGVIDDQDRVYAGSYQPVAYFGINLGLNYKSFDFSMAIYGNVGNEVYNGKKAARFSEKDNIEKDVAYNRWTPSNQTQSEPAANTGFLPASTYFVESGDFIRINNLTLGYTLPGTLLSKIKASNLRVFITAQNLLTLKKYSGFTAELPGDPLNSGIELSAYPTTRTFAAGVNIGF